MLQELEILPKKGKIEGKIDRLIADPMMNWHQKRGMMMADERSIPLLLLHVLIRDLQIWIKPLRRLPLKKRNNLKCCGLLDTLVLSLSSPAFL
mmetsp:Transcript_36720/g.56219  ORF Transcript_36720/g.56219 Transcript_36720/m.56219 type:complete len:93 (-) Transcript_36720:95-373(-)